MYSRPIGISTAGLENPMRMYASFNSLGLQEITLVEMNEINNDESDKSETKERKKGFRHPKTTKLPAPKSLAECIQRGGKWKASAWKEWNGFLEQGRTRILTEEEFEDLKKRTPSTSMIELGTVTWRFLYKITDEEKSRICFRGDVYRRIHPELVGTFASATTGRETIRLLFAIAAQLGLTIDLLDIKQAFLGVMRKEAGQAPLYLKMQIPDEQLGWKTAIVEVLCNIYGDTTAQGAFQDVLNKVIKKEYLTSTQDVCLFRGNPEADRTIFATVVDDILRVSDPKHGDPDALIKLIETRFKLKIDKKGERFCGATFKRCEEGVFIYQEDIIRRALEKMGWDLKSDPPKGKATPMVAPLHHPISDNRETPEGIVELDATEKETYQTVLGVLMFLDYTRIDCQYAIRQLSRHAHRPSNAARIAMGRVLRYLWNTRDYGILYKPSDRTELALTVYYDSSHGTQVDATSTKSQTGIIACLNGTPIAWVSQKQGLTCGSSTESEVVALSEAVLLSRALVPMLEFIRETMGSSMTIPPVEIYTDNSAAINLVQERLGASSRTKHFSIRQQIVREWLEGGHGNLTFIDGPVNPSDMLTKPPDTETFKRARGSMMWKATDLQVIH